MFTNDRKQSMVTIDRIQSITLLIEITSRKSSMITDIIKVNTIIDVHYVNNKK